MVVHVSPKIPSWTSLKISSASLASTHLRRTMSWFLLYNTSSLNRKFAANLLNIRLSFSVAVSRYSQSLRYCSISKYQGLPSGSKHMTGDASQLTNLKLRPARYVTYGDNNRGRILGVGDIGGNDKVIIKDVLLVEDLKHSLLSISRLCDKECKITFEPNFCLITDSKLTENVLVGKRVNNVYMLNVSW